MTDPVVEAAVPSLVAVLQGVKTFVSNLGTDPAQVPLKFPGALAVFLGTVQLQFPALASAEFGALQTDVNGKIDSMIAKLQGK